MNKLNHIAFIMDGNGRWGKKKGKSRNFGHINGVNTVKKIVQYALQNKIPILSFYVFSTENWKRPKTEIKFLFNLINTYFKKEIESVMKNKIRIKIIGNLRKLPLNLVKNLKKITNLTKKNKNIIVNLALNYGSKNEITETVNKLIKNKITINEKNIENQLYTKGMPLPDILVRTGGQNRLSNFMLWQLAYSEIYFKKKLWPDFNEKDLKEIIRDYKKTKRNFGNI
jgi:undecaprenyl diphosphate synthase